METKIIMPKTKTPLGVYQVLLVMIISLLSFISFFFGFFPAFIILFMVLAFTTHIYTESNVPPFHALILISSISGKMRVIFPGLNLKLPWENPQIENIQKRYIDVRIELSEVCNETYSSKDAEMNARYVYTIRPNISDTDNAAMNILIFSSFDQNAIKSKGRALFSMMLSDYYGKKEGENILNKQKINEEVFGIESDQKDLILQFEKKHGTEVTVRLEDSDFPKDAQKFRDMISGAKSIDEAMNILMADSKGPNEQIIPGMSREKAEKMVKLINLENYKETDFNLNVTATGLTNLQNITVLGAPSIPTGEKSKDKGGKK